MLTNRVRVAGSLLLVPVAAAAQAPAAVGGRQAIPPSAVAATLTQAGLSVAEARLHLPGSLSSQSDTPQLKVTSAEQRANGSLSVRFACQSAVECMPFFVTVDAADDRPALAAFAGRAQHQAAGAAKSDRAAAAVAIGAHVTLQLTDAQMRIQLPAVAIDTGAPGTEVRVASLDRKHTWRGVVVDATTVRGGVQ